MFINLQCLLHSLRADKLVIARGQGLDFVPIPLALLLPQIFLSECVHSGVLPPSSGGVPVGLSVSSHSTLLPL